jgi:hypothetical protein
MPRTSASRLLRRARFAVSFRLLRAANALSSSATRVADLATSFASRALDPGDRNALTAALYSSQAGAGRPTLYAWEEAWLRSDLPAPPARVLLGGAGRGRETSWLIDRGYTVVAFDPARAHVAQHNASCPEAHVVVLDYESLAHASQARRDGRCDKVSDDAASVLDRAPYDAALLGWGSVTHVLEERDQDALFEALALLVPHGPVLASFFMSHASPAKGRAAKLGAKLGKALGPAPHAYAHAQATSRVWCLPHLGFAYSFDRERLAELAALCGRTLELHLNSYPHATFR